MSIFFCLTERIIFTDCRQLPLAVTPQTDVFAYVEGSVDTPLPEGSCTVIRLQAKRAGHTVITATYSADGIDLKASITIAAFDPLLVSEVLHKRHTHISLNCQNPLL